MKSMRARMTPEALKNLEQKEAAAKEKQIAFVSDLNETFGTPAGKTVLRYLLDVCGYQRPSVVADPATGEIMIQSTVYNEARRNLYLSLRKHLRAEILRDVETRGAIIDEEKQVEDLFS